VVESSGLILPVNTFVCEVDGVEELLLTLVDKASRRKRDSLECLLVVSICYFVDDKFYDLRRNVEC